MGQFIGKAIYHPSSFPFLNLSYPALSALWDICHDVSDDFALTLAEFQQICLQLTYERNDSKETIKSHSKEMFQLLDTDNNGLIDAIEFYCCIAIPSGLADRDKLQFIFQCFDFAGTGKLSMDEMELALRSTILGLRKLTMTDGDFDHLKEEDYEGLVVDAFREEGVRNDEDIPLEALLNYCIENPDCRRFIAYHDSPNGQLEDVHAKRSLSKYPLKQNDKKEEACHSDNRKWMEYVESLIPSEYVGKNLPNHIPNSQLELEWIHGYSDTFTDNVRYTARGEICYHAANIGVIFDTKKRQQRFFNEHSGHILSFTLHPDGTKVATGEEHETPNIIVWDINTLNSVSIMKGFHKGCVSHLSFNDQGTKLVSIGGQEDGEKYLAIYDWKRSTRLYSSSLYDSRVKDLCFGKDDIIAACGVNHVYFWSKEGRYYTVKPGIFGKCLVETQTSIEFVGDNTLTGTISGNLNVWKGRNCVKVIKAHKGSIDVIHVSQRAVITGGEDAKIRIWTLSLNKGGVLDISSLTRLPGSIRSLCISVDGTKILVGMRGSEIFEVSSADGADVYGGAITTCHAGLELYDVSTHPLKDEYCTVASDQTIRMWDISTKTNFRFAYVKDGPTQCVAFSPDGELIAVGIGEKSGYPLKDEGSALIMKERDLGVLWKVNINSSVKHICDIKFSLDGEKLFISNSNGDVFIYFSTSEFKNSISEIQSNGLPVSNIDFSEDESWLQATRSDGNIVFAKVEEDKISVEENLSIVRDISWSTRTCPFGWHSLAAWRNCHGRESVMTCDLSESENVLVTGDTNGRVQLFRYPCSSEANSSCYTGHSGSVSKVRFANSDLHVISIGLKDRCIFQWKYIENDSDSDDDEDNGDKLCYDKINVDAIEGTYEKIKFRGRSTVGTVNCRDKSQKMPASERRIFSPKDFSEQKIQKRETLMTSKHSSRSVLELDFIYGYNTNNCRSLAKYSFDGSILYHQANVGIKYNRVTNTQQFHLDHEETIVSFAISPCRRNVATGSLGESTKLYIWDSVSTDTTSVIKLGHKASMLHLAFSLDSELIACGYGGLSPSVRVYRWKDSFLKFHFSINLKNIVDIVFFPNNGDYKLFVLGRFRAFTVTFGANPYQILIKDGNQKKKQTFLSCTILNEQGGLPVVGTSTGNLLVYEDTHILTRCKGHDGPVNCLVTCKDGRFISGGNDGKINIWNFVDSMIVSEKALDMCDILSPGLSIKISTLDISDDQSTILVGTEKNELFEVSYSDGSVFHNGPIINYHDGGCCHGVAFHPSKKIATAGNDGVRIWSCVNFKEVSFTNVDAKCTCLCYSNDGRYLAVGIDPNNVARHKKLASFLIFQSDTMKKCFEGRDFLKTTQIIKYSPDDKTLGIVYIDSNVVLYEVRGRNYSKKATIDLPDKVKVINIEYTLDSRYLRLIDKEYNYHYIKTENGQQISVEVIETQPLKWNAKAQNDHNLLQIISSSRNNTLMGYGVSKSGKRVVISDANGTISLWQLYCDERQNNHLDYCGHSRCNYRNLAGEEALLKNLVTWACDDTFVFTLGLYDNCIFQWRHKVIKEEVKVMNKDEKKQMVFLKGQKSSEKEAEAKKTHTPKMMPWESYAFPPEKWMKTNILTLLPRLDLNYIHGRQTKSNSLTVTYNLQGDVLYPTSNVGIIFDSRLQSQKLHESHTGEITCMSLSSDRRTIATANEGQDYFISLWDSSTGQAIASITSHSVRNLAFSRDGTYLASIGYNDGQEITIYRTFDTEWSDPIKVVSMRGLDMNSVFAIFIGKSNFPLVVASHKYLYVVTFERGSLNYVAENSVDQSTSDSTLTCGCLVDGIYYSTFVTGTNSGFLQCRPKKKDLSLAVSKSIFAHQGGVTAVSSTDMNVVSGGNDGKVFLWDSELVKLRVYRVNDESSIKSFSPSIRSVSCDQSLKKILVGVEGGEILEISKDSGSLALLSKTHALKETYGLSMHPSEPMLFATSDDGANVIVWSILSSNILRRTKLDCGSRALSWSPSGNVLCVGMGGNAENNTKEGGFIVLDSTTLAVIFEDRQSKKCITDIKYTYSGDKVAMASEDGAIYIHDVPSYKLKVISQKQMSPILNVDFSEDGDYIQAQCNQDLMFFSTKDGCKVQAETIGNVNWNTYTCPYGWSVKGLWYHFYNNTTKNCCILTSIDSLMEKRLGAYVTSLGSIGLFSFPSPGETQRVEIEQNKLGLVSKVRLNCDVSFLISLEKSPNTIMQYRIRWPSSI